LYAASDDQPFDRRRESASKGRHCKYHRPGDKCSPAAEPVASSAADKDQPAKKKSIGVYDPLVATNRKGRFCSGQPASNLKPSAARPSGQGPVEGAAGAGLDVDRFDHGDRMAPSRLEFIRIQASMIG
jgi:hypothetical protein